MDRIIRATAGDGAIKMAVINARDTVERARQTICHGRRLLWCSMMETSISSPTVMLVSP